VRLDDRDRGRILLAVVVTLIALPAIWLVNRDDDGPGAARPNVAAAGIDPGEADAAAAAGSTDVPADAPTGLDPMGGGGAAYLESKPTTAPPPVPDVAIGTTPGEFIGNASATYRAREISPGVCEYNEARIGDDITVINVANGRSIRCTVAYRVDGVADAVVMHTNQFRQLADLISAPIHVEVRR
jgi:hypothetical protein